jgi:branched-chain amino acid transport system ATP-binding protein
MTRRQRNLMLELLDVEAHYGRSQALFGVSCTVAKGEAVALLGPNAAGKSTTLKCISRLLNPSSGSLRFEGEDMSKWSSRKAVEEGLIQVPEGRQLFPFMSVQENLELGSYSKRSRPHRSSSLSEVFELLPLLKERRRQLAGTLSGGEQQMVAIGRALMSRPLLLMLDEPSLGLSPVLVKRVFATIARLKAEGMTLLLVEQNVAQALKVVDRAYVLETGKTIMSGPASALVGDPAMRKAYFGIESVADVVEEERAEQRERALEGGATTATPD